MAKSGVGSEGGERSVPRQQVDRLVRSRIAEIMSAAGVDIGRIGLEVVWNLPPDFVRAYENLWRLVAEGDRLIDGRGELGKDAEVGRAKDPKSSQMGGGANGRTKDTDRSRSRLDTVVVRSGGSARRRGAGSRAPGGVGANGLEGAAELKERVDKRLRAIARDVAAELMELYGLDVSTGEVRVKVDTAKVGQMRGALARAAKVGDDIDDSLDE